MSLANAKVTSREPLPEKDAVWTKLVRIKYQDPKDQARTWESAERTTRPKGVDLDGVGVIAILDKPDGPEIVLQKQFRPPVEKVTIEIPAGLIDAGETAEECAIRELKEETGYIGTVLDTSTVMFNDPGFCNTNLKMVHLKVDMSLPENQNPQSALEDDEFIEVFHVPLGDLFRECKRLEAEGYAIDARVGTFAEGLEIAKKFRL